MHDGPGERKHIMYLTLVVLTRMPMFSGFFSKFCTPSSQISLSFRKFIHFNKKLRTNCLKYLELYHFNFATKPPYWKLEHSPRAVYYHSNLFEDCEFWFRNASARENHSTREKATRGGEREHFSLSPLRLAFLALAIVGISPKRSWGPENELRCSFCKEERMATEQNLKHCRIVGPIFLAIRPFTVLYFSVRSSRDRALCVTGCHLARVSNLLRGQGRF